MSSLLAGAGIPPRNSLYGCSARKSMAGSRRRSGVLTLVKGGCCQVLATWCLPKSSCKLSYVLQKCGSKAASLQAVSLQSFCVLLLGAVRVQGLKALVSRLLCLATGCCGAARSQGSSFKAFLSCYWVLKLFLILYTCSKLHEGSLTWV